MTAPEPSPSSYGSAQDWAQILSAIGQGTGSAMQGNLANAGSRKEAKEAKRRTISNMLNQALRRNQGLFRHGQDYADDMNDYQSQAMQQVARGFTDSLKGSI